MSNIENYPLGNDGLWQEVNSRFDDKKNKLCTTYKNSSEIVEVSHEDCKRFNQLQLEATKRQFSKLSIFQNNSLELDGKDVYKSLTIASQANYLLENRDGTELIKARGYQIKKECYLRPDLKGGTIEHPYREVIRLISKGQGNPYSETVFQSDLLGANDYNKTEKVRSEYNRRQILPFGSSSRSTKPNPLSMSMFWYQDWEHRKFWDSLNSKTKIKTGGYGLEIIVATPEQLKSMTYYDYERLIVLLQDKIDSLDYSQDKSVDAILKDHKSVIEEIRNTRLDELKKNNVVHPDKIYLESFEKN